MKHSIHFFPAGVLAAFMVSAFDATSQCVTTCTATASSAFNLASTWGGTAPATCNCFVIPNTRTVTVSTDLTLSGQVKITIQSGGTLSFDNNKELTLSNVNSTIVRETGGALTAAGGGGNIRLTIGTSPTFHEYSGAEIVGFPATGNLALGSAGVLPVELTFFEARKAEKAARLRWQTASELGSDRFEIERSTNGAAFEFLGAVGAAGFSSVFNDYLFEDESPVDGANFYRLRMIDRDGSEAFSNISSVAFDSEKLLANWANEGQTVDVRFSANTSGEATLQVFDLSGRLISSQKVEAEKGQNVAQVDASALASGLFFVRAEWPGHFAQTVRLIKI